MLPTIISMRLNYTMPHEIVRPARWSYFLGKVRQLKPKIGTTRLHYIMLHSMVILLRGSFFSGKVPGLKQKIGMARLHYIMPPGRSSMVVLANLHGNSACYQLVESVDMYVQTYAERCRRDKEKIGHLSTGTSRKKGWG